MRSGEVTVLFVSFAILFVWGLLCAALGPFFFIASFLGLPLIAISSALGAYMFAFGGSKKRVSLGLAAPVLVVLLTGFFDPAMGLLSIGVVMHLLGVILFCVSSPFILSYAFKKDVAKSLG